jgi:hypothetical protein
MSGFLGNARGGGIVYRLKRDNFVNAPFGAWREIRNA